MDFEKLKQGFLQGKKQKIFFKDGSNVFTHGLPLSLYRAVLEQEPSVEKYTEPNGTTPLFYVDTVKKFNRLVEHGFDIYAKDAEGISLDQELHPAFFVNLSDKALCGFNSENEEFLEYYKDRLEKANFIESFGGSHGASIEQNLKKYTSFGGNAEAFLKVFKEDIEEQYGSEEEFLEAFGGTTPSGVPSEGTTPLVLHSKMLGHRPDLDNASVHTPHSSEHDYAFTTDARNEFKTFTTKEGYGMLEDLAKTLQPVLETLRKQPGFSEAKGFEIYTEKENLKFGATWSDEEYADPSFLYQYCLNKAMQRFPESIEMMNAAFHFGALPEAFRGGAAGVVTVVSLGGGCSYELLAVKAVFAKYLPKVKLRLVSLDYEPFWAKVVEPLGIEFDTIDFNKPVAELKKQLDPYKADFYVMSFVYRTYIKNQHADFIRYLCKSSFGIFINDRNTEYLTFDMMSYKLSKSGFLTLISDQFEGYPYVEALTQKGYPVSIYKDTPWSKVGAVRTSGRRKVK